MPTSKASLLALPILCLAVTAESADHDPVQAFLDVYNAAWDGLDRASNEAGWLAQTDITDVHSAAAAAAQESVATFLGTPHLVREAERLQRDHPDLPYVQRAQLERIRLAGAANPGSIPDILHRKIEAEAKLSDVLYGHPFVLRDSRVVSPNDLDDALADELDLTRRLEVWEVSKTVGNVVRPGLAEVRDLRNRVARESGDGGYFDLQVRDYGMSTAEMMATMDGALRDLRPLYEQLHCWAKHVLARRYGVRKDEIPRGIPAHWLPNRWAQEWPGLVDAVDLDPLVAGKTGEEIVKLSEAFYTSMGFPALPASFWQKSDLYDLPAESPRQKNKHASAWNIDRKQDVRSLMSVRSDFEWFSTSHHELGHIYYDLAYNRDEIPPILRDGANRAFHEAVGELASLVTAQPTYLKQLGLLGGKGRVDPVPWLLNDALNSVVFMQFAAGTMAHWERDLYEEPLAESAWNDRWWRYVTRYQGVVPPSARPPGSCDACTKTHVVDDPAGYYDYALATLIKFQIHDHIAREILGVDPRDASYYGRKDVGAYLLSVLSPGASRDWRELLREATGSDLNGKPMLDYFVPLQAWLQKANKGCDCRMPEPG